MSITISFNEKLALKHILLILSSILGVITSLWFGGHISPYTPFYTIIMGIITTMFLISLLILVLAILKLVEKAIKIVL
jgi:hypothetical protein